MVIQSKATFGEVFVNGRGAREVRVSFNAVSLTHSGGLFLLHRFLQQLRLRSRFAERIRFVRRNIRYTISDLILCLHDDLRRKLFGQRSSLILDLDTSVLTV